jgi:hypothetical protein
MNLKRDIHHAKHAFKRASQRVMAIFHCSRFARAVTEQTLLNFLCSCLTCAFFVRLAARGHAMKVELFSTFLVCSRD